MKTQPLFKTLLLLALLLVAGGFSAKAQEDSCAVNVIHTYMNGRLVPWDSVEVRVCMPPCEYPYHYQTFKMYWPDTILANCATRIDEYVAEDKLELSQNYPNPCQGESSVKLTTRMSGSVRLQVMDVQGRLCCQRTEFLSAGLHTLSLNFPRSGLYFVTAETADGRATCKMLCSEGKGSTFTICLSSTSPLIVEKVERGGEGMFGMTDEMYITTYITYNGEVRSNTVWINTTYELEGYEFSAWIHEHGAINIFFNDIDSNANISFSGNIYKLITSSETCLPFAEIPVGYTIHFSDSIFYSIPEAFSTYTSSTWWFNGWFKYRYYPQFGNAFVICGMNETLPDANVSSLPNILSRNIIVTSDADAIIYSAHEYLAGVGYERLVRECVQGRLPILGTCFLGCTGNLVRSDTIDFQYENNVLSVFHHLTLNCAASNVIVQATLHDDTIEIVYYVDDNISANCVCPTQLEYTIGEISSGTYNVVIRLDNQIIYQQSHNF